MKEEMHPVQKVSAFWFRRDLRLEDNTALSRAIEAGYPVLPVFIFDTHIIDELARDDARIGFIYKQLQKIHKVLLSRNSSLYIFKGEPHTVWKDLIRQYDIQGVYINKDYEPYALNRDAEIAGILERKKIGFHRFKDQVIFEEDEIVKKDGKPYTVFTPYKRKWLEKFPGSSNLQPAGQPASGFQQGSASFPSLGDLGFRTSQQVVRPYDLGRLEDYPRLRDLPAPDATSHLSPHLRFGTISIRKLVAGLGSSDEVFLSELIWREFFMQILWHFPRVVHQNFNPKYNGIRWLNNEEDFQCWCRGETGYPMVDAGMRQLNRSGYMHNRVRMVTAGFLCKHLLIDWRMGEAYFAEKLLDYELSSNNGNWQWAAGTGCDAAPYFRIFNPVEQVRKFDRDLEYVKQWIPEYGTSAYSKPMIDHRFARKRALDTYWEAIANYLPG